VCTAILVYLGTGLCSLKQILFMAVARVFFWRRLYNFNLQAII